MRRKARSSRTSTAVRKSQGLDAHTQEAVTRFVRLLAHCGITPEGIAQAVLSACRQVPKSWSERAKDTLPYLHHTSHVLTLWYSDPRFLGPSGAPRPLPVLGKEESIEALARQVDPRLQAFEVVRFLEAGRVLRRVGRRYVPRARALVLRGSDVADSFRKVRGLLGMLRAFDHNQRSKRQVPGWFEAFADNPRFPVRAIPRFDDKVRAHASKLLLQLDGDMHREERLADPDEPTVRIGVGVYRFEEARPAPARSPR
ncbi:MAG: hypothetical protein JO299_10530, partial [Gammaproteobacteria bacterium]|nr:hypothetical protein [Gammaproteobacteria bacterium]